MMYAVVLMLLLIIDQCTKWYAWVHAPSYIITGTGISWCWVLNYGVSWSLFSPESPEGARLLIGVLLAITSVVLVATYLAPLSSGCKRASACIVGGALSNILDRFTYGGVADWIVLQWHGWIFPVFNIADIAIVCGVLYLVVRYEATT